MWLYLGIGGVGVSMGSEVRGELSPAVTGLSPVVLFLNNRSVYFLATFRSHHELI